MAAGSFGKNKGVAEGANKTGKSMDHAHSHPGRKYPSVDKVRDAKHDQGALNRGKDSSLGVSADGSHKGLKK
jgi:hypothetical protein